MRGHRAGHHEPVEETLAYLAMSAGGGGSSSAALYGAENAGSVLVNSTDPTAPTPVASVSITVAAGQTVSITGSINFQGFGSGSRPVLTLSVDSTVVDAVTDLTITGGESPEQEMTSRTTTLPGLSAGAHTIDLGAASPDGAGGVSIPAAGGGLVAGGQLTVLVAPGP